MRPLTTDLEKGPAEAAAVPVTLADLIPGIDPTLEEDLARVLEQIANGGKVTGSV
jgi:hypothetical protein